MRRLACFGGMILLLNTGCQKAKPELSDKIANLEKRIEVVEKKLNEAQATKKPQAQEEQAEAFSLPVGESYVWGNPDAPLTLVKFSDYQCPFCSRAHESFIEKVFEDPELKDKIKVVFKHFPLSFHKSARPASKAALAAGEQGHDCFWKMTKALYSNQRELTEDNFKKLAKDIKCKKSNGIVSALDSQKFWSDYKNKDADYEKAIKEDMELGMKGQVRGTPSFFVNGWKVPQRSVEGIKKIIEEKHLLPKT